MKKSQSIAIALLALSSVAWAASNLNSSKSNIYRMMSSAEVTQAQAKAFLDALEINNPNGNATVETVKKFLQQHRITTGNLIFKYDPTQKPPMIYVLTRADAAQAGLAVSPGANQPSLLPPQKGAPANPNQQGLPPPGPGAK